MNTGSLGGGSRSRSRGASPSPKRPSRRPTPEWLQDPGRDQHGQQVVGTDPSTWQGTHTVPGTNGVSMDCEYRGQQSHHIPGNPILLEPTTMIGLNRTNFKTFPLPTPSLPPRLRSVSFVPPQDRRPAPARNRPPAPPVDRSTWSRRPPVPPREEEPWEKTEAKTFGYDFLKEMIGNGPGTDREILSNLKRMVKENYSVVLEFSLQDPNDLALELRNNPVNGKEYDSKSIEYYQDEAAEMVEASY